MEIRSPKVAAVVVNWNRFDMTVQCVEALQANSYLDLSVVIVDNGSTDGSLERLRARFPGVRCIGNGENRGFSRGCNVGVRAAMEDPMCAFVLLVNNDCILPTGVLEPAVRAALADPGVGIVTAKIVDEQGRIWHAGGTLSLLRGQSRTRGFREKDVGQFDTPCDTEWASGALMLIRREVVDRVGALPEEYFFGVEEWDYSITVRRAGYRIRYVPNFHAMHPGGGSHDNHDPKFAYNYYRSKLIFQEKHLGRPLFRLWLLAFRLYLEFRMRRHVAHLATLNYANPADSPTDDVVFAARMALQDHGKNRLSEVTMLEFDAMLRSRRTHTPGG
jgi:GT2 family glycosyltransferase